MKKTVIIAAAIALVSAFFVGCDNGTKTLAELKAEADKRLSGTPVDLSKAKDGWQSAKLEYDFLSGSLLVENTSDYTQVAIPVDYTNEKKVVLFVSNVAEIQVGVITTDNVWDEAENVVYIKPGEWQKVEIKIPEDGINYIKVGSNGTKDSFIVHDAVLSN